MEVKLIHDKRIYHVVSELWLADDCIYVLEGGKEARSLDIEIFFNTKHEADDWLDGATFCRCGNTAWLKCEYCEPPSYYCDDCYRDSHVSSKCPGTFPWDELQQL